MRGNVTIEGLEVVDKMLQDLGDKVTFVGSYALYEGAGKMAEAVSQEIDNIQTAPFKYAKPGSMRLPSPEEKAILQQDGAFGIAQFDKNGSEVNTHVGFDTGYANVNWNHMSSKGRTNYKAQRFKGYDFMTTSTLKFAGVYRKGVQNAKPIPVIANAINSGTSFMKKQPFIRKAISRAKAEVVQTIAATVDRLFRQIISEEEAGGKSA